MKNLVATRGTTLGPFLTLILLASSRRGSAAGASLELGSDEAPASISTELVLREEAFPEPQSSSAVTPGPFLALILNAGRRWADYPRQEGSACGAQDLCQQF